MTNTEKETKSPTHQTWHSDIEAIHAILASPKRIRIQCIVSSLGDPENLEGNAPLPVSLLPHNSGTPSVNPPKF